MLRDLTKILSTKYTFELYMITNLYRHVLHVENVNVSHDVDVLLYELGDGELGQLQHEV